MDPLIPGEAMLGGAHVVMLLLTAVTTVVSCLWGSRG